MKREQTELNCENAGDKRVLQKRPRLQDSADFLSRLVSITLTRDHLMQLDALFADSELLEQFSSAVSGCLVLIDQQVFGLKTDVIAQLSGVVKPMRTQQLCLPRRILVINLGYFGFDQVVQQMPDQTAYGAWIADMEMQSLPLPSDEFLREKALALRELLSQADTNVAGGNCADEGATKVEEEEEGLMDGREEQQGGGGRGQEEEEEEAPHGRANRQGIMSSMGSEMLATCSFAAMKEEEADSSESETEYELDDDENGEEVDDMEAGQASMAGGLVATWEHLRTVRVPLFMVRLLVEHNAGDCLQGCLVVCHVHGENEVIMDEIDRVTAATGEIRFKHSQKSYQLTELQNKAPNEKLFDQWVEKMAKWGEQLPPMAVHKNRLEKVIGNCKRVAKQLGQGRDQKMLWVKLSTEMKTIRTFEQQIANKQGGGTAEGNLKPAHQEHELHWSTNKENILSSSSSSSDESTEELPMDKLVHTKELLDKVCLSYDIVQTVARYPTLMDSLRKCFVKCRTRDTNEKIVDAISKINLVQIKFKHSEQPILLKELCVWNEQISTDVFAKWIEDMTRWDEPLPSIRICKRHNKRALRALKKTKQFSPQRLLLQARQENRLERRKARRDAREKFEEMFGSQTWKIVVDPRQLVQLLQLGEAEFTRVATGLFVCVLYTFDNGKTTKSMEQIRTVSFDRWQPYTMFGHRLTVRLHFERLAAASVPIFDVQFANKNDQRLVEQHTKMVDKFVPPSAEFIQLKKEQLRCALAKTSEIVGKAKPWLNG